MKFIRNLTLIASMFLAACAQTKPWGRVGAYYDTRGMPTASITGGATDLPLGAQSFGFLDAKTDKKDLDSLQDPYMEINLARKATLPGLGEGIGKMFERSIGPIVEYNRDFSQKRGIVRAGLVFEPDVSQFSQDTLIGINVYPVASEDAGPQIVFYGNKGFNDYTWYVDGFLDYNFDSKKVVSEIQLGRKIWGDLYGIVEARHNGFFEQDDQWGVGVGLEFHLK